MPVERWSTAQIEALAPDASSVKAARGLSGAGSWSSAGLLDEILWGVCKNYQVCVDLSGPAYKCSCPSRKIPCKHTLGLLLRWADSGVPDGPAPQFAGEWQAARAAKANAKPREAATPDPVAAAKRAGQRDERVAGGMAELGRWLDDQIQQGLAGTQHAGASSFDTMAARLVDAQAPAAANWLRRVGESAGIGPHWADRLLGELALLRLLVTGHDRLGELPAGLAATVRTRIGFPISSEEVLAGPHLADRWQVLGQADSDDGALSTRRTWLRGAQHGRFALVLSFAPPGQSLPADLVPGTEFRGELAFFPGTSPLRALVATRDSAAERFAEPDGAAPFTAALDAWTTAAAADPWLWDAPLLLQGVAPATDASGEFSSEAPVADERPGGGKEWLVDGAGQALPLAPGYREPWWLLAAAGGEPVTLAAEWSPAGLRPLAAWVNGEFVPAPPPVPDPAAPRRTELPADMLAAALVGTDRRPWTGGSLLEDAAAAVAYRRAGVAPVGGHQAVAPAPAETQPALPGLANRRLARILAGGVPGGTELAHELLVQWLTAAGEWGGHVPPAVLPALFDSGRRNTLLRPLLGRVAGERGRWLAAMRDDWRWLADEATATPQAFAVQEFDPAAGDEAWETGTSGERAGYLAALRAKDPARARELLESTWRTESSDDRARFVRAFATGLSTDDDAFLDRALDDRRKEVREAALELLRRLPGSGLGARMTERAREAVQVREAGLLVTPPGDLTTALRRDGVAASPPSQNIGLGAWLLEEVVAGTPLSEWPAPGAVLRLATGNDWETPLLHGWAKAAVAQQRSDWAVALIDGGVPLREQVRWDLHLILPPAELGRLAATALRAEDSTATRLLNLFRGEWPEELCVAVLESIADRARHDRHTWLLGELCRAAALSMPPGYADLVGRLAAQLQQESDEQPRAQTVSNLARALTFRQEMATEFAP